ncbi:hypothetical protein DCS_07195 [Drechmeria coniospora]|uniref:Uncharacterized protein n=1 Tax=Drechmeria coniospora TaxID=98403 RepID=A0A151GDV1_DRECN|nr:hypothetical protein DCS_07195 [Drechmeria coniospora]KYK55233.1 hypothetical protein DCS_07195 [Drechmeria coniospora]
MVPKQTILALLVAGALGRNFQGDISRNSSQGQYQIARISQYYAKQPRPYVKGSIFNDGYGWKASGSPCYYQREILIPKPNGISVQIVAKEDLELINDTRTSEDENYTKNIIKTNFYNAADTELTYPRWRICSVQTWTYTVKVQGRCPVVPLVDPVCYRDWVSNKDRRSLRTERFYQELVKSPLFKQKRLPKGKISIPSAYHQIGEWDEVARGFLSSMHRTGGCQAAGNQTARCEVMRNETIFPHHKEDGVWWHNDAKYSVNYTHTKPYSIEFPVLVDGEIKRTQVVIDTAMPAAIRASIQSERLFAEVENKARNGTRGRINPLPATVPSTESQRKILLGMLFRALQRLKGSEAAARNTTEPERTSGQAVKATPVSKDAQKGGPSTKNDDRRLRDAFGEFLARGRRRGGKKVGGTLQARSEGHVEDHVEDEDEDQDENAGPNVVVLRDYPKWD